MRNPILLLTIVILSLISPIAITISAAEEPSQVSEEQVKSLLVIVENSINTIKSKGIEVPKEALEHLDKAKKLIELKEYKEAYKELIKIMILLRKIIMKMKISPEEIFEIQRINARELVKWIIRKYERAKISEEVREQLKELIKEATSENAKDVINKIRVRVQLRLNEKAMGEARNKLMVMLQERLREHEPEDKVLATLRKELVESIRQEIHEWLSNPRDIEKGIILVKHYCHLMNLIKVSVIHMKLIHTEILNAFNVKLKGLSEVIEQLEKLTTIIHEDEAKEIIEKLKEALNYTKLGISELKEAINQLINGNPDKAKECAIKAKEYANKSDEVLNSINATSLKPPAKHIVEAIIKLLHRVNNGIRHVADLIIKYADKLTEKIPVGAKVRLAGLVVEKEEIDNETVKLIVKGIGVAKYNNETYVRLGHWILIVNKTSAKVKVVGKGEKARIIVIGEVTGYEDEKPVVYVEKALVIKAEGKI